MNQKIPASWKRLAALGALAAAAASAAATEALLPPNAAEAAASAGLHESWMRLLDMYLEFSGVDSHASHVEFLPMVPSALGSPTLAEHNRAVFDLADALPARPDGSAVGSYSREYATWLRYATTAPENPDPELEDAFARALSNVETLRVRVYNAEGTALEAYELYVERQRRMGRRHPLPFKVYASQYEPEYVTAQRLLDSALLRLDKADLEAHGTAVGPLRRAVIDADLALRSTDEHIAGLNMPVASAVEPLGDFAGPGAVEDGDWRDSHDMRSVRMDRFYDLPLSHSLDAADLMELETDDEPLAPTLTTPERKRNGLFAWPWRRSRLVRRSHTVTSESESEEFVSEYISRGREFVRTHAPTKELLLSEAFDGIPGAPEFIRYQELGRSSIAPADFHELVPGRPISGPERYAPLWDMEAIHQVLAAWRGAESNDFTWSSSISKTSRRGRSSGSRKMTVDASLLRSVFGVPLGKAQFEGTSGTDVEQLLEEGATVRVSWKGMRLLRLRPGWWFQPNFATVHELDPARNENAQSPSQRRLFEENFGANGTLERIHTGVLVGINPTVELELPKNSMDKLVRTAQLAGGLCVFGICAKLSSDAPGSSSSTSCQVSDGRLRLARNDDAPIAIARLSAAYKRP